MKKNFSTLIIFIIAVIMVACGNKTHWVEIKDEDGNVVEKILHNNKEEVVNNEHGYAIICMAYEDGKMISEKYFTSDSVLINNEKGWCTRKIFDSNGLITFDDVRYNGIYRQEYYRIQKVDTTSKEDYYSSIRMYSHDTDTLSIKTDTYHGSTIEANIPGWKWKHSDTVVTTYMDKNCVPILFALEGYSKEEDIMVSYFNDDNSDENANSEITCWKRSFYDSLGNLMLNKDGYAISEDVPISKDSTILHYYDVNGRVVNNKKGYAYIIYTYPDSILYFPSANIEIRLNGTRSYFDVTGKTTNGESGFARIENYSCGDICYDESGNKIEDDVASFIQKREQEQRANYSRNNGENRNGNKKSNKTITIYGSTFYCLGSVSCTAYSSMGTPVQTGSFEIYESSDNVIALDYFTYRMTGRLDGNLYQVHATFSSRYEAYIYANGLYFYFNLSDIY